MHIILSRKGFDSSYGGSPSIILPNNKMISFPIPVEAPEIGYKATEIHFDEENKTLADYLQELKIKEKSAYHVDPEIQNIHIENSENFIHRGFGTLGQWSSAATHLANNEIQSQNISDKNPAIFLFFGLFQKTKFDINKRLIYTGNSFHAIWGYLIATQAINVSDISNSNYPELKSHLHYINKDNVGVIHKGKTNVIFRGNKFETFMFSDKLRLSIENQKYCTKWEIPDFIEKITHNKIESGKTSNGKRIINSAKRGQEFIITKYDTAKMNNWLNDLGVIY